MLGPQRDVAPRAQQRRCARARAVPRPALSAGARVGDEAESPRPPLSLPPLQGAFLDFPVSAGRWRVVGAFPEQRLQLWIETEGYARGDNALPPGPLYLSTNVFGRQPSKKPGVMSIEATRLLVRRERRMVGTFTTVAQLEPDEDPSLPPARFYFDDRNVR